jgi:hypothetical protein
MGSVVFSNGFPPSAWPDFRCRRWVGFARDRAALENERLVCPHLFVEMDELSYRFCKPNIGLFQKVTLRII